MKKRSFEQRDGELVDRDAEGKTVVLEPPLFAKAVRSHKKKASPGELAERIEANDWTAAHTLVAQRERRSADALAKRASPSEAVAYVLGALGGPAARKALEKALKKTGEAYVAAAILGLDPEADHAAKFLVRAFHRGPHHHRVRAVGHAANLWFSRRTETAAMDRLAAGLRTVVRGDEHVFVEAIPALCELGDREAETTIARVRRILTTSKDKQLRMRAVDGLSKVRRPFDHVPILREWLANEPSIAHRMSATNTLAGVLDEDWIVTVARKAFASESPAMRLMAFGLLDRLDRKMQRRVLRGAVRDEPDEELRNEMRRRLKKR